MGRPAGLDEVHLDYFERMLVEQVAPFLRARGMSDWPIVIERDAAKVVAAVRLYREALERVLDLWPAPSPAEFARLHRLLTGFDSCAEEADSG